MVDEGRIAEQGTYQELMAHGNAFSRFVTEFGTSEKNTPDLKLAGQTTGAADQEADDESAEKRMKNAVAGAALMQVEERNTGAVTWDVYKAYGKSGHAKVLLPLLVLALIFMNGATVVSSYWLVWWQEA